MLPYNLLRFFKVINRNQKVWSNSCIHLDDHMMLSFCSVNAVNYIDFLLEPLLNLCDKYYFTMTDYFRTMLN